MVVCITHNHAPQLRILLVFLEFQTRNCAKSRKSNSSLLLSYNLIGQKPNKRFYVTEIVLQLELADVTFRGRETTAGNTSAFAGYVFSRFIKFCWVPFCCFKSHKILKSKEEINTPSIKVNNCIINIYCTRAHWK